MKINIVTFVVDEFLTELGQVVLKVKRILVLVIGGIVIPLDSYTTLMVVL